jgi:hypothetical protein
MRFSSCNNLPHSIHKIKKTHSLKSIFNQSREEKRREEKRREHIKIREKEKEERERE